MIFTCTRASNSQPIDIDDVPVSVVPLIRRKQPCTISDIDGNVQIWYVHVLMYLVLNGNV